MEEEITELEKEYSDLEEIWKAEKASLQGSASIKEKLEQARIELEAARRADDLTQYVRIAIRKYSRTGKTIARQRQRLKHKK